MSQPASTEPAFDFGTLSHSTLPDLSLINQPKLTLDLGTTDLSVSLDELKKRPHRPAEQAHHPAPATSQAEDQQSLHSELDRNRSRRWTSLSELGRAVIKPSVSNLRQLGSLNERSSAGQQRTAATRRLSEASGTPSIYSSYRANRNIFKLWSHEPPIESSPPASPSAGSPPRDKLPTLPPMPELLDGSLASFNHQDLCSITEPISLAQQPDPASNPVPALNPLPPSPSPSAHSEPASEPAAFASAVQSPTALDPKHLPSSSADRPALVASPEPRTPSLKSCQSSPVVPSIARVLSQAEDHKPADLSALQAPPPATPKDRPEDPTATSEPAVHSPALDPKTPAHPAPITTTTHSHLSKTNLAGILGRKKKTTLSTASAAGPGPAASGPASFFKLFLLKGLGFKHHHAHPLDPTPTPPAPGRPSSSSTASSPAAA
ncbi:hypothetical protein PTTG_29326 [Puccinia triticina 1-1 BBBD Race 1]|uniref:Uncharacterized protein n=1 Tax=Puccinia triticina (isolate 1-1 / race 1 (BBBD)) TaxID=630390 RepID=A0A180G5H4_PUCT1|nr:hypothetical protein PTTG_29326 [Puccinia triticina 1-1 BBBD Race 1]